MCQIFELFERHITGFYDVQTILLETILTFSLKDNEWFSVSENLWKRLQLLVSILLSVFYGDNFELCLHYMWIWRPLWTLVENFLKWRMGRGIEILSKFGIGTDSTTQINLSRGFMLSKFKSDVKSSSQVFLNTIFIFFPSFVVYRRVFYPYCSISDVVLRFVKFQMDW